MVFNLPQAVLFDNDGVLSASEPLHWEAWAKILTEMGIPYRMDDIAAQVGKTGPQIMAALLDIYRPGWNAADYDLDALALRKNDFYLESARQGLKTFPGVEEGLKWLRSRGVKTAVVTNAKRREMEAAMRITGLAPYLDAMVSRDDVPVPKPDPAPFLLAAALVGVEPARCLGIDDSPIGLEAGLMAGMPCASVTTNFKRMELEAPIPGRPDLRPIWIGASLREFFEWLKSLTPSL